MSVCLIRPAIDEGNIFYAHDKLALSQDVSSISLEYIPWGSYTPTKSKKHLVKALVYRTHRICSPHPLKVADSA